MAVPHRALVSLEAVVPGAVLALAVAGAVKGAGLVVQAPRALLARLAAARPLSRLEEHLIGVSGGEDLDALAVCHLVGAVLAGVSPVLVGVGVHGASPRWLVVVESLTRRTVPGCIRFGRSFLIYLRKWPLLMLSWGRLLSFAYL